jgi:hypothetical protein
MLKHALDHDLIVTVGHQVIDPIKTYLDSADEAKIQYAKDHVKSNRQKYGGTAEEVILSLNEGNLYGDLINQRKFAKESAKATFHNHCKDNDFTNLEADLKNLREYNALDALYTTKDKDGRTAFRYAVEKGNAEVFKEILGAAKDHSDILKELLNAKDKDGSTAFHYAVSKGKTEVVKEILAAAKDNPELLKEVLNAENKYGETALHRAVNHLQIDVVEKILDAAKYAGILKKINLKPLIDWKVVGNEGFAVCDVNDLVTQFKGLIPPAKWSHVIPDTWVSKISERGTYWKERDALIEVVVNKYLEDMGCEIRDHRFYLVTKSMESIEEEIKKIITSHEEEIKKFLSETGHYNVEPKQIKEAMEECGKDSKDSFVNRILNKEPNTNTNPFNAF